MKNNGTMVNKTAKRGKQTGDGADAGNEATLAHGSGADDSRG